MSERKIPSRPTPSVEVVRHPIVPVPRPLPRSSGFAQGRSLGQRDAPFTRSAPSSTPSGERIQALARKERVPARIAKGELQGKMKCRIWKRLHSEEAKRFDQAYSLMAQHQDLSLEEAFGLLQSERSIDSLRERRLMEERRAELNRARREIAPESVDRFVQALIDTGTEVSLVLGDRTLVDVVTGVSAGWFQLQRLGRLEKLKVVLLAARGVWESRQPELQRESRLAQRPAPIIREPDRRPVADPRPFLPLRGKPLLLTLRNGMQLRDTVAEVGPFDLLLGDSGGGLFVPFHAIVRWTEQPL